MSSRLDEVQNTTRALAERAQPGMISGLKGLQWFSRHIMPWLFLLLGFVVIPALYLAGTMDIETVNMFGRYLAFAIVAVGLDLVWGYTGMLCLCQSLFFALGGYAMGLYLAHHGPIDATDAAGWGIPRALYVVSSSVEGIALPFFWKPFYWFPLAIVLGVVIPAVAAFIIGYFGFRSRVRGVFFAILTQAITLGAWLVFCRNDIMLCGTNGLTNFVTIAGFDLTNPHTTLGLYLATLVCLVGVYLLSRSIANSRLGRVLVAVRDNESRLRFSGYKPYHFKVFIFTFAGMVAGLGGMLYTPQADIMTPKYLEVEMSILMVVWVAVGGRGTLSGAVLGVLGVNLVYNWLTTRWPESWPFVQGGLFIGVVLLFPAGLMGLWHYWMNYSWEEETTTTDGQQQKSSDSGNDGNGHAEVDLSERLRRLSLKQRATPATQSWLDADLMRVENLTVVFDGFKALDIESFSVPHYALQVIIGPNGAGKTTLCDVISGKTRPTTGHVYFADREITNLPDVEIARLGVGRKFQTPTVFDSLTVAENLELALPGRERLPRNFRQRATFEETDRIHGILQRVRLLGEADTQVKYLSHGQRQWLEISMLVLADPRLLLVDEPAAGLTDEETALTAELLLELQDEHSIIVIEHDMEFVRLLNSQVTVLNEGKIMAQGSMQEVQSDPKVVEAYLGR